MTLKVKLTYDYFFFVIDPIIVHYKNISITVNLHANYINSLISVYKTTKTRFHIIVTFSLEGYIFACSQTLYLIGSRLKKKKV